MGRHAAPPPERPTVPRGPRLPDVTPVPPSTGAAGPAQPADDSPPATRPSGLRDGVLLAVVVGLVVGAVAGWSTGSWSVAALTAAGAAVVTLGAAWVAGTVPGRGP